MWWEVGPGMTVKVGNLVSNEKKKKYLKGEVGDLTPPHISWPLRNNWRRWALVFNKRVILSINVVKLHIWESNLEGKKSKIKKFRSIFVKKVRNYWITFLRRLFKKRWNEGTLLSVNFLLSWRLSRKLNSQTKKRSIFWHKTNHLKLPVNVKYY